MVTRTLGVSEARRLLPELVHRIASEGGRVDITYRGRPQVSLLRVADVKGGRPRLAKGNELDPALRVELKIPPEQVIEAIREIRASHRPRARILLGDVPLPKTSAPARPKPSRARGRPTK